jgi:hypothetical protein
LPDDLIEFYQRSAGAVLFSEQQYSSRILEPRQVVPANPLIAGVDGEDDISSSWYVLVDDGNREFLTIDLSPERLGRCYDSFSDRHAIPGSSQIIALSFSELLERTIQTGGEYWYWLRPDFQSLGDAYD